VIKNYLDAIGGEGKINQLKDLVIESEATMNGETVIFNLQNKRPDKLRIKRFLPASNQILNDFSLIGDSLLNNDSQNKRLARSGGIWYDPFPEMAFKSHGYTLVLADRIQLVNERPAYLISATSPDGDQKQYFYDFYTGLKLKERRFYPTVRSNEFADYREIDNGIKIPFSWQGDWEFVYFKYKVKSVRVNTGIPDDAFK
jgi:hypothetical protein